MKAVEVCSLLNEAYSKGANLDALMGVQVYIPLEYAKTTPIECFQDVSNNAWFGTLGLVNAIIEDRDCSRIYLYRGQDGKSEFRVSVRTK